MTNFILIKEKMLMRRGWSEIMIRNYLGEPFKVNGKKRYYKMQEVVALEKNPEIKQLIKTEKINVWMGSLQHWFRSINLDKNVRECIVNLMEDMLNKVNKKTYRLRKQQIFSYLNILYNNNEIYKHPKYNRSIRLIIRAIFDVNKKKPKIKLIKKHKSNVEVQPVLTTKFHPPQENPKELPKREVKITFKKKRTIPKEIQTI
jgi:hypothetical protein